MLATSVGARSAAAAIAELAAIAVTDLDSASCAAQLLVPADAPSHLGVDEPA
jgi:hypothetical protein